MLPKHHFVNYLCHIVTIYTNCLTLKISVFSRKNVLIYCNPYFVVFRLKPKGENAVSAERLTALSKRTVITKTCVMNSDA